MQNLRILSVTVNTSTSISIAFTDVLTPNLIPANISIISDNINIPSSEALQVSVTNNTLNVTCLPLTYQAIYYLQFNSVPNSPFVSLNGGSKLLEDDVSNKYLIIGPMELDNPVLSSLKDYFNGNIYEINDTSTVINSWIELLSKLLSKALYDIGQTKNENYLSINIFNERKIRGQGPSDRLDEEGAYQISRVGYSPSNSNATLYFNIPSFPSYPVTLQKQSISETLQVSSNNNTGYFNINNLILNLSNNPIIKLNSIIFTFTTSNPIYTYNIEKYGYQILNSRYDPDYASNYLQLNDNQIRLNEQILQDPNFFIDQIYSISITYEYKKLGRIINPSTLEVNTILSSIREVVPPIINIFNLNHAPIIDNNGNIPTLGGIIFIDPNANTPGANHPAFLTEIIFNLAKLPSSPGQYSIDYNTGTVYVFGNDIVQNGTGPYPPLATYNYKFTYQSEIDYVYDNDLLDLTALPLGSLTNSIALINFKYEEVFIPGKDYVADLHIEKLSEYVDNRFVALNAIKTLNSPITNVFRIYNETTGEIYAIDRWFNDTIYFRYYNPPNIRTQTQEKATFTNILNELLIINSTISNTLGLRIFKIYLSNNSLISSTEDCFASSINTSLVFSADSIFINEKWYNRQLDIFINLDKLENIGEYSVDYINGIIYCAVSGTQNSNIGTVSYKNNNITPQFKHITTVNNIYYKIININKTFTYLSFEDSKITINTLDYSDETFLNNNIIAPYQLYNGNVGIFTDYSFLSGVTYQVKLIRAIYEYQDLSNSVSPLNFAQNSIINGTNISVGSINNKFFGKVEFDGARYFVTLNLNIQKLSPNINYSFSVIRPSTLQQLWNPSGSIILGNSVILVLSNLNSPINGEMVSISYTFTINNLSRVVVDYNKGDFYIDYTYLADEIIISYEYGDNDIDFRKNKTLQSGSEYYVSYKAGALRDALYQNFGKLINIPELTNFDINFNRERYREAIIAALSSFIQGPTISALKNMVAIIVHTEPEIIESAFKSWVLGTSLLYPESIHTNGSFKFLPAKYNNGVLIDNKDQSINFPFNSNLRLEEGTFETWIIPQWNGLDNDAELFVQIFKDGIPFAKENIFIGSYERHSDVDGEFRLNKNTVNVGTPNRNKNGIFIYYDKCYSGIFNRWFVEVIDQNIGNSIYNINIHTNGTFYDVKNGTYFGYSGIMPLQPTNISLTTGISNIKYIINGGGNVKEGFAFVSDVEHYLLDFGDPNKNRFSIFKDASGYFNFKILDKNGLAYIVSADVSHWSAGIMHHIATSWKLNTIDNRDEMHLFIDGLEVPNIIRFGQNRSVYAPEKFRTIDIEEIISSNITRDIVGSIDLITTAGSPIVSSSINFSAHQILPGDTIYIDEQGFSTNGYIIQSINGQTLTLTSLMPISIINGTFSVNRVKLQLKSNIDVASNIAVSTLQLISQGIDLSGWIGDNILYSPSMNFSGLGIKSGDLIKIQGSLNKIFNIISVDGNKILIFEKLNTDFKNLTFYIYSNETELSGLRALRPDYSLDKSSYFNNILTISNGVKASDTILIRTFGLNNKKVIKKYYAWSDSISYVGENILMTRMPPPISLDEINISKILLPSTLINLNNSTLTDGYYYSNNISIDPISRCSDGKEISVYISGSNIDFTVPIIVTIHGRILTGPIIETISFTNIGTNYSSNKFIFIDYTTVVVKPINTSKNALTIEIREKDFITNPEDNDIYPVVKYSYIINEGTNLNCDGHNYDGYNIVTDENNLFSDVFINNCLIINYPIDIAGYYNIIGLSDDRKSLFITPTLAASRLPLSSFVNGTYIILNTTSYRSGLQNGFFIFEIANLPGEKYSLTKGLYELEYYTYSTIKIEPNNSLVYLGSRLDNKFHINSILDQTIIYSTMLTDTRVGEFVLPNQRSITQDYNSLVRLKKDINTLILLNFDKYPFFNSADLYINTGKFNKLFRSTCIINKNFGDSAIITSSPIVLYNNGILDNKEGTIEFWINPIYDTANDPNERYYFDAFSAVIENTISNTNVSIKINHPVYKILSVTLQGSDPNIDYFAGGKIELDTQNAVSEQVISNLNNSVTVSKVIFKVLSVKIVGDLSNTDYFSNGVIDNNGKTIYLKSTLPQNNINVIVTYVPTGIINERNNSQIIRLNKKLPAQNSNVVVKYIPNGLQGDRISIYKDRSGCINFGISASNTDFIIKAPIIWSKNTWHRVKASYKINGGIGNDEMRLFLDGYDYNNILYGSEILLKNYPNLIGTATIGDGYFLTKNIVFKDPINEIFIGNKYSGESPVFSLINNLRISNVCRPIYAPYGEPIDVNYNSNLNVVFPVTNDLYTTYLLNFENSITLNNDFAELINRNIGIFDFSVNIFDTFDIVNSSPVVKNVLEKLINILKPAVSRVFINYM